MGIKQAAPHAVILKLVTTNICGSDQHMVRGRTTAPAGQTLGHEITGEVVEAGDDVLFVKEGDICSVPFNIACGRCRMCNEGKTGICLNVNPARAGAAYGYVDMGGWLGGQAEYVMIPYADFNLLKFPDRDAGAGEDPRPDDAVRHLPDRLPRRLHRRRHHRARPSTSRARARSASPRRTAAQLLGAAVVIVGDMNADRLDAGASFGCVTVDLSTGDDLADMIEQIVGEPEVDAAVDAVGFEARGHGEGAARGAGDRAQRHHDGPAGGRLLGIPGLYVTGDPGRSTTPPRRAARREARSRLGEVARLHDRPVPGEAVQPAADEHDPARQGAHREGRQRQDDQPRRGAPAATRTSTRARRRSTSSTRTAWSPDARRTFVHKTVHFALRSAWRVK